MNAVLRISCLLLFFQSFSQPANNQQKLSTLLQDYFSFEREIIHVQFNKMLYVNNEVVAFKGYAVDKNSNTPNLNTTNIHLAIYNDKQEIVQKQLLFASNGTFDGNLQLDTKFASGKYYFHFYTNWMNNFKEDDSFIQTIEIIDKNENYNLKSKSPNLATAAIKLFPENGIIVDGITNAIGIKINDCNQRGISVNQGIIVDSKSNEITQFSTNKMGNGFFYFIPQLNEKYYAKVTIDKKIVSQELPAINPTGLLLSYNNYLPNNILAINIHTNAIGVQNYQNKKLTLLVHQNKVAIQKEFTFDNKEENQIIRFDKKILSNGVNIIRVLDENQTELAQRLVYNDKVSKQNINLEATPSGNDSIVVHGKFESKFANLSISVLPEESEGIVQRRTIQGTLLLNAYLQNPELDDYSYFDPENSNRKQDLELLMITQGRSKCDWENIVAGAPKIEYRLKKGVTINGIVEKNLNPKIKYKISLFSLKDNVFEETYLDKDNKFQFENFYAKDSTSFLFQLSGNKDNALKSKIFAHVVPTDDRFEGRINFEKTDCPILKQTGTTFNFKDIPANKNSTSLGTVVVKNNFKKEVFLHKNDSGMFNSDAYKIENEFGTILNFLSMHGFRTELDSTNSVRITSNRNFSNSRTSTEVFIDNFKLYDLDPLYTLYMDDVDEVYIDKMGYVGSIGYDSPVKIYLKPNAKRDFYDPKFSTLIVTSAFTQNGIYKNSEFETPKEYFTFGTLKWQPNIPISENQSFSEKVVKANQKNIQVYIEGFDADGNLYSEIKKLAVTIP